MTRQERYASTTLAEPAFAFLPGCRRYRWGGSFQIVMTFQLERENLQGGCVVQQPIPM